MREIQIDLSSDYYLQQPKVFGGYVGEHNESKLVVKLPNRMIRDDISYYYFEFQTVLGEHITSPNVYKNTLSADNAISIVLWEQLSPAAGNLKFCVNAIELGENGTVTIKGKTPVCTLYISESPTGEDVLIDAKSSKEELQKSIDSALKEAKDSGEFKGEKGDPGYTPVLGVDYVTIDQSTEFIFDGGNADQSIPTDIVVDDTLSDSSTNAVMNKAVTQKLSNIDNRIERNSARNLSDRYILFIGDSYADNWTANNNVGWIEALNRQIASALGIDLETDEGKNFGNTHYARVSYSGLGFSAITSKSEKKGNAYDELGYFIENNTDFMNKVTDVVFALGYNDAAKAVSSASSTYDDIKDKINLCNTLINHNTSHYVNKYLFAVGWGSNPDVRWQANHIYKNVYGYSAKLGWIYSDLRYIMYDSDLYYEDWIHPNMNGSEKIAGRILNTLLGNSSIVTCKGRYYTTTTSKENTVNVGYLNVVNNELAQFFLSSAVIYDGDLVTVPQYGTQEICEITGLAPFGQNGSTLISDCSFHILDAINNTGSNVVLGCYISKKYCETVGEHDKYKSYLNIKNITDSEIKFNKLAPNNGVINIVPYL